MLVGPTIERTLFPTRRQRNSRTNTSLKAEANLTNSFVAKLNKALPAKKVTRYLQSENKIGAVIKYDFRLLYRWYSRTASSRPYRNI